MENPSLDLESHSSAYTGLAKLHRLTESGLESEEWKEALESLTQHTELYSE